MGKDGRGLAMMDKDWQEWGRYAKIGEDLQRWARKGIEGLGVGWWMMQVLGLTSKTSERSSLVRRHY
jgi:hypothetical protein